MPLQPEVLTWTALLGQWMQFAQAALTLPSDAQGERWRQSVTPIITLQAATFALGDLPRLPRAEWPLAFDKAELLISQHAGALKEIWQRKPPPSVREIIDDSLTALAAARQLRRGMS